MARCLRQFALFFRPAEEKQPDPVCFLAGNDTRLAPIKDALAPFGLRGEQFASLAAMLEAAAERNPDLVFLDLTLTVARCHEAIAALAALPKRCAIQLVSPSEAHTYEQVCAIGQLRLSANRRT